jgi:hypothetical protein
MVAPTCFGITLPSSRGVPRAFWEMLNWGAVDRILWIERLSEGTRNAPWRWQCHAEICRGYHTWLTFWHRNLAFKFWAHPVCKMRIIQEPKKVALWNKQRFKEEKMESVQHVKKIQYIYLLKKYIKWECLEGSGVPVLYIGRTVPKG